MTRVQLMAYGNGSGGTGFSRRGPPGNAEASDASALPMTRAAKTDGAAARRVRVSEAVGDGKSGVVGVGAAVAACLAHGKDIIT